MDGIRTIQPPVMSAELRESTLSTLTDKQHLESTQIKESSMTGLEAMMVSIKGCTFENTEISASRLKKASISNTVFTNCLLFGSDFDSSGLTRVAIKKGMYSGIVLSAAVIEDVTFTEAKLNLANFRVAKLERVEFVDCDLSEADFQGADLKSVLFKNCDLSKADFNSCTMGKVDLRGSNIASVNGVAGLKGAKIDTAQLITISHIMASELGLEVDD